MADHDSDAPGAAEPSNPEPSSGGLRPLDPGMERSRTALIDAQLRRARGVLHLGAHIGQERDEYARRNLPVVWVEAHPIIHRRLQDTLADRTDQYALCGLLAEVDGRRVDFGRSANVNGESSSMYEFAERAHALWPDQELYMTERVPLTTVMLDSLLAANGIASADYDFWVLDLQGAELDALEGAARSVQTSRALLVEVSTVEVYRGAPLWPEIRDHLGARGLAPAWSPARAHDDVLFVRERPGAA